MAKWPGMIAHGGVIAWLITNKIWNDGAWIGGVMARLSYGMIGHVGVMTQLSYGVMKAHVGVTAQLSLGMTIEA